MKLISLSATLALSSVLIPLSHAHTPLTDAEKKAVTVAIVPNTGSEFVLTVSLGDQTFRTLTILSDFSDEAIAPVQRDLKEFVGWRDNYLFVRQRSGRVGTWRSTVDQVFTVQAGKLIHLGAVNADSCSTLACGYDKGEFRDIYDGLEVNPATGAVDTPPLPIVRVVKDGQLVSDIERTWQINQAEYQASLACVEHAGRVGIAQPCAAMRKPWSSLVFAAKLTHYTGRTAEREALFGAPAKAYCEKTPDQRCSFRVAGVKDHFSRFARGDAPSSVPHPVRLASNEANDAVRTSRFGPGKVIQLK